MHSSTQKRKAVEAMLPASRTRVTLLQNKRANKMTTSLTMPTTKHLLLIKRNNNNGYSKDSL